MPLDSTYAFCSHCDRHRERMWKMCQWNLPCGFKFILLKKYMFDYQRKEKMKMSSGCRIQEMQLQDYNELELCDSCIISSNTFTVCPHSLCL